MILADKLEWMNKLNAALNDIRPHLEADGGDVEIVELSDDMVVYIKWKGNCETCDMSAMTLKAGIEQTIKTKFPQIKNVIPLNGNEYANSKT